MIFVENGSIARDRDHREGEDSAPQLDASSQPQQQHDLSLPNHHDLEVEEDAESSSRASSESGGREGYWRGRLKKPTRSDSLKTYVADAFRDLHDMWGVVLSWIGGHLNFYRSHMIIFTLVPLIAASIFWAADKSDTSFVNALTVCVSAMTVTGLNPVLMENISHVQQAILFFLCCIGSTSGVSLITIIIRRHFFKKRFENMVKTDPRARKRVQDIEEAEEKTHRFHHFLHPFAFGSDKVSKDALRNYNGNQEEDDDLTRTGSRRSKGLPKSSPPRSRSATPIRTNTPQPTKKRKRDRLRVDMIRRVDEPVRINQMNVGGFLSEEPKRTSVELQDAAVEPDQAPRGRRQSSGGIAPIMDASQPRSISHDAYETLGPRMDSPAPMSDIDPHHDLPRTRRISIDDRAFRTPHVGSPTAPPGLTITEPTPSTNLPGEIEEEEDTDSSDADGDAGEPLSVPKPRQGGHSRRSSDPAYPPSRTPSLAKDRQFKRVRTLDPPKPMHSPVVSTFPRSQTIEIKEPPPPVHERLHHTYTTALPAYAGGDAIRRRTTTASGPSMDRTFSKRTGEAFPRTATRNRAMTQGFGGFPNPVRVVASAAQRRLVPKTATLDMNRTATLQSVHSVRSLSDFAAGPTKAVSYISFDAVVGRNSRFYSLTSAQRDELGGVEYRALSALLKIVAAYYVFVQLIPMIIFAPLMQSSRYRDHFTDQGSITNAGGWYAAFNIVSAYSNAGLSLLDDSMVPFQRSYGYVLVLAFCILAGNTAFPCFLRLSIWIMSKLVPTNSRFKETLQFLLDHPRRCFIYLFPSHQTWILVIMLVVLNLTDWICFLVLDIGSEVTQSLPPGVRVLDGLFQAFAVRAAGFSIVPLSETAPALQVLYVVMMYIAVYPIAMSIRSTNVYEEKSLGVFVDDDTDSDIEAEFEQSRKAGSYFAHHARKQLAFDIWWLALALWAICIVEKTNIQDPATDSYFTPFTIMFELVSAYGTVGLSLGSPNANYSLCGDFRTLSKIILCAVMIRGRHRGLPVAIDRSILLPSDIEAIHAKPSTDQLSQGRIDQDEENAEAASAYFNDHEDNRLQRRQSRRASMLMDGGGMGNQRPRRMSSSLSGGSAAAIPNRQSLVFNNPSATPTKHKGTGGSSGSAIQFAPTSPPNRETSLPPSQLSQQQDANVERSPSSGGLASYLTTVYSRTSEATSPAPSPQRLGEPNEAVPSASSSEATTSEKRDA